jgi:hypothetical protein
MGASTLLRILFKITFPYGVFIALWILLFSLSLPLSAKAKSGKHGKYDTIFVTKGARFLLFGRVGIIPKDTFFLVPDTAIHLLNNNNLKRSALFYDSIYKKMSRYRITRLLYPLAFKPPPSALMLPNAQAVPNESPFLRYKGKIIRKISIRVLAPFGTQVDDTSSIPITAAGRTLNSLHIRTQENVIRKNLQIKQGQIVDAGRLADNERILREMPYLDKVHTLISEVSTDSVDVFILTKDVWSIGFDVTQLTPMNAYFRLYDANFLGLGDLLSTNFSFHLQHAPFARFEQASYQFSNIAGSFIDCNLGYQIDADGDEKFRVSFQRSFYSFLTKWAGGASFQYLKSFHETAVASSEYVTFNNALSMWLGRSVLLHWPENKSRFIIMESYSRINFPSRPDVTLWKNPQYYNSTQIFSGIALSRNNYYLSEYVFQFGKPENLPYGSLYQLTFGPEFCEFYTRYYFGADVYLGRFFNRFGYLSGRLRVGGYLNKQSMEDAVLKAGMRYFTPLLMTPNKAYKFRSFLSVDYRYGFNMRPNNFQVTDLSETIQIHSGDPDSLFRGTHALAINLSTVMYAPWYFYGFKFGIISYIQTGFIAKKEGALFGSPLFSGIGLGILIKNDNLIFPTFMITGFLYPSISGVNPYFQYKFINDLGVQVPDYNAYSPRVENLQN